MTKLNSNYFKISTFVAVVLSIGLLVFSNEFMSDFIFVVIVCTILAFSLQNFKKKQFGGFYFSSDGLYYLLENKKSFSSWNDFVFDIKIDIPFFKYIVFELSGEKYSLPICWLNYREVKECTLANTPPSHDFYKLIQKY